MTAEDLDVRDNTSKSVEPHCKTEDTLLYGRTDRPIKIATNLPDEEKRRLKSFLEKHITTFAWTADGMPGLDSRFACRIMVNPDTKPVKQKKRNMGWEKAQTAKEEIRKLLDAKFIREIKHSEWLFNIVIVKKPNRKPGLCVDFKGLNKQCPKDSYPLPSIDLLVDSASRHSHMSTMDAFSGYHQLPLAEEDQEKTAFITDTGTFCYRVLPFGWINSGAAYTRVMNKMFEKQIGRNVEIYVDDLLAKSNSFDEHLRDLAEIFEVLDTHQMKLNPHKCAFAISARKFLVFLVHLSGIDANPSQIKAIADMEPPQNLKEAQRLCGRVAAM